MPHAEALAPALLERVLSKLGLSEPPSPTLEGLRTLYPAWCRKVPFDNIRQLIHRRSQDLSPMPGGDATEFFEAWLVYGTGGTCWSGNGALHALLLSLGFEAARGLCTMLVAPDIPPNHGSVLVVYEGSRYVVDASILHSEPLRLDPDAPSIIVHPAWGVQCEKRLAYTIITAIIGRDGQEQDLRDWTKPELASAIVDRIAAELRAR